MKEKSKKENIEEVYTNYFKNDIDNLIAEIDKSKEYSAVIDEEINKIKNISREGTSKGYEQHYLIEHLQNAIALQVQIQGLHKDLFTIKKTIMDYTFKDKDEKDSENKALLEKLNDFIDQNKKQENTLNSITTNIKDEIKNSEEDKNLDKQIDKELQ